MTRLFIAAIVLCLFVGGCSGEAPSGKRKEPGVVDYLSGNQSIKAYKDTRTRINDINDSLQKRYEGIE